MRDRRLMTDAAIAGRGLTALVAIVGTAMAVLPGCDSSGQPRSGASNPATGVRGGAIPAPGGSSGASDPGGAVGMGVTGSGGGTSPVGGGVPNVGAGANGPVPVPPGPPPPPAWAELPGVSVNVRGGVAASAGGQAQPGGTVHLVSQNDIVLDPARPAPSAPLVPAIPAEAATVTAASLVTDVTTPRGARVGDAMSGGAEPTRIITASSGDLFIEGTLRSADLGSGRQGVTLAAPAGTVYIAGTVDTSGGASSGQAGGPITITAQRVVVTGRLDSSGGDHASAGGAAGIIRIDAEQTVSVSGRIDAYGGNVRGTGVVVGGKAADLIVEAGGDVVLVGVIRLRGGAATGLGAEARGGPGSILRIGTDGAVHVGGTVDGRGGLATAATAGGIVAGGAPGGVRVGLDGAIPGSVTVVVPVDASGGEGHAAGGMGGVFRAEPGAGNVVVAGARAIDVSGGGARAAPGGGGRVSLSARDARSSGGVTVLGGIFADGGGILQGGAGAGAVAGQIELRLTPLDGEIDVGASGQLSAVGGRSGGAAVAGGGGHIFLITNDGDLTMAGTITVVGGEAPDPGGTGGSGGAVQLFSDRNGNADEVSSGNLLIAATGLIDASGGNGSKGGSARNDGIDATVAEFPTEQEKIAILVDCDNVDGDTLTWLENRGRLVARGGASGGDGGDVMFHGIMPDEEEPQPGNIDLSGNGNGKRGDFGSE
jgi:hypothetical protein